MPVAGHRDLAAMLPDPETVLISPPSDTDLDAAIAFILFSDDPPFVDQLARRHLLERDLDGSPTGTL